MIAFEHSQVPNWKLNWPRFVPHRLLLLGLEIVLVVTVATIVSNDSEDDCLNMASTRMVSSAMVLMDLANVCPEWFGDQVWTYH